MKLSEFVNRRLEEATSLGRFITGDLVGIEIELENVPLSVDPLNGGYLTPPPKGWDIHRDGSLRNNGVEFVFSTPAGGQEISNRLESFNAFWKTHSVFNPDPSSRTSVHVHVNALNCTPKQLFKWIMVYTIYERILFNVFAPERLRSNFCIPICDSLESIDMVNLLKRESWTMFYKQSQSRGENRRYSAVNLDAVRKFGSLEFRHLSGTLNTEFITKWVQTLLLLKSWAMNPETGFENFFHGPSKMYSEDVTRSIFGWEIGSMLTRSNKFAEHYLEGVRNAQILYMDNKIPSVPVALSKHIEALREEKTRIKIERLKKWIAADRTPKKTPVVVDVESLPTITTTDGNNDRVRLTHWAMFDTQQIREQEIFDRILGRNQDATDEDGIDSQTL